MTRRLAILLAVAALLLAVVALSGCETIRRHPCALNPELCFPVPSPAPSPSSTPDPDACVQPAPPSGECPPGSERFGVSIKSTNTVDRYCRQLCGCSLGACGRVECCADGSAPRLTGFGDRGCGVYTCTTPEPPAPPQPSPSASTSPQPQPSATAEPQPSPSSSPIADTCPDPRSKPDCAPCSAVVAQNMGNGGWKRHDADYAASDECTMTPEERQNSSGKCEYFNTRPVQHNGQTIPPCVKWDAPGDTPFMVERVRDAEGRPTGEIRATGPSRQGACWPLVPCTLPPSQPPPPGSPPVAGCAVSAGCSQRLAHTGFGLQKHRPDSDLWSADCTHKFEGRGNPKPCDGGHRCCERADHVQCEIDRAAGRVKTCGQCEPCHGLVCDDPRGCAWEAGGGMTLVGRAHCGREPCAVDSGGRYGFKVEVRGTNGWVKACPPPSPRARNAGEPLQVLGNGCQSVQVEDGVVRK